MNLDTTSSGSTGPPCHGQILGQSATTRALFCQEVAELIFSNLSLNSEIFDRPRGDYLREHFDKDEQREKRRTLASAARVSKYISEVALSVLWARLHGFDHLFELLPQCVSSWDRDDSLGLSGDPSGEEWATLQKYAALVREMCFHYLQPSEQKVWAVILNRYGSVSGFLPRLKALSALYVNPADALSDPFLLSPTLRHLSIQLDTSGYRDPPDGGALLTAALERIVAAIPSLSSLKISRGPEPQQISWTMPSFKSMRNLDITPRLTADASVMAAIGQYQHLRVLCIRITDDCVHLRGCLQALTRLSIGGRAVHIQSFFAATSPPLLQSLGLFFMHDPSTELLAQCVSAVLTAVPPTLSALVLESNVTFNPPITSAMDVIQPALSLRSLTRFIFKFKPLPSLTDADISVMLTAWPFLATLRIPNDRHLAVASREASPSGSRPTAHILPTIAARCPRLHTLELPEVDLDATPALDALPPPLGHQLRTLDLASWCADRHACMRAAVMLDRLFPFMALPLIRGDGYNEREETGWAVVVRLLSAMQAGRRNAEAFEREGKNDDGDGMEGESEDEGSGSGPGSDLDMGLEY